MEFKLEVTLNVISSSHFVKFGGNAAQGVQSCVFGSIAHHGGNYGAPKYSKARYGAGKMRNKW